MFALHPRIAADTVPVLDLALSRVLLMNDRTYPWVVLVPMREGTAEIHDLEPPDRAALMEEIARAAKVLMEMTSADKMNVAMLGNIVPQLHIHVIARFHHDPAWPRPVWGMVPPTPYDRDEMAEMVARLRKRLGASPL